MQSNLPKAGYSISEICMILGVCRDTLYREINSGRIQTFKVGPRRRFVSQEALQNYIKQREAETA